MSTLGPQINRPGTYFFTHGTVRAQINKECVLLFYVKSSKKIGAAYFDPIAQPIRSLHQMLDSIYDALKKEQALNQVEFKMFGMSVADSRVVAFVYQWAKAKKIHIDSEDIGRNTTRYLHVDCATGKVGVQYAEGTLTKPIEFLTSGSAKARYPQTQGEIKVLILSEGLVEKQLSSQAADESDFASVESPKNLKTFFAKKNKSSWDLVLLSDDLLAKKGILKWMDGVQKFHRTTKFAVLGSPTKKDSKKYSLLTLSKPTPEKISDFKGELNVLLEGIISDKDFSSNLLTFKGKKSPRKKMRASR